MYKTKIGVYTVHGGTWVWVDWEFLFSASELAVVWLHPSLVCTSLSIVIARLERSSSNTILRVLFILLIHWAICGNTSNQITAEQRATAARARPQKVNSEQWFFFENVLGDFT